MSVISAVSVLSVLSGLPGCKGPESGVSICICVSSCRPNLLSIEREDSRPGPSFDRYYSTHN